MARPKVKLKIVAKKGSAEVPKPVPKKPPAAKPSGWGRVRVAAQLKRIYDRHNPDKIKGVGALLEEWEGDEEELLRRVRTKYGEQTPARRSRNRVKLKIVDKKSLAGKAQAAEQALQQAPTQEPELEGGDEQGHGLGDPVPGQPGLGRPSDSESEEAEQYESAEELEEGIQSDDSGPEAGGDVEATDPGSNGSRDARALFRKGVNSVLANNRFAHGLTEREQRREERREAQLQAEAERERARLERLAKMAEVARLKKKKKYKLSILTQEVHEARQASLTVDSEAMKMKLAVLQIETQWRIRLATKMRNRQELATRMQAHFRGYRTRKYLAAVLATSTIQYYYRRHLRQEMRRKAAALRKAVLVLQRRWLTTKRYRVLVSAALAHAAATAARWRYQRLRAMAAAKRCGEEAAVVAERLTIAKRRREAEEAVAALRAKCWREAAAAGALRWEQKAFETARKWVRRKIFSKRMSKEVLRRREANMHAGQSLLFDAIVGTLEAHGVAEQQQKQRLRPRQQAHAPSTRTGSAAAAAAAAAAASGDGGSVRSASSGGRSAIPHEHPRQQQREGGGGGRRMRARKGAMHIPALAVAAGGGRDGRGGGVPAGGAYHRRRTPDRLQLAPLC